MPQLPDFGPVWLRPRQHNALGSPRCASFPGAVLWVPLDAPLPDLVRDLAAFDDEHERPTTFDHVGQRGEHLRIDDAPDQLTHPSQRLLGSHFFLVRTRRAQSVPDFGGGEDPSQEGGLLAAAAIRISGPVPALVMAPD